MTNFEKIKSMSENELVCWLANNGKVDNAPWDKWFNQQFCEKCETEKVMSSFYGEEVDCAFCEAKGYCRYFPDRKNITEITNIIQLWLEENAD